MADNTGAAFGVFPQMRPRRARQDREAAANAPLSALRGWAAGTAGLPGDIEGLLRMLVPGVSNEPALPTSEFYKEWLPGRSLNETPTGRAFTEAGSLAGGVGVGPLSRVAATGARAGGRLGAEALMRAMERGSPLTAMANPMYVVKPKGGNWLSGSVEGSLSGLKPIVTTARFAEYTPEQIASALASGRLPRNDAISNWIDKQLTRYVKNEMATPEDPIRALAEKWAVDKPAKLAEAQARIDALANKIEQTAGQRGVPPEYLTSMRQQMIGLEKQKELLQLREGLHVDPENLIADMSHAPRLDAREVSKSPLAKAWERSADVSVSKTPMSEYQNFGSSNLTSTQPWLQKLDPEEPMYRPKADTIGANLGFTHLIDELRNATNPESGLPKELLLKYQDLPKITLPQAVERVADINAWRAAQKAEADLARANNAATVLHKEYPDKGFKWVELKSPGFQPDESGMLQSGRPALEDALKYEGDTMGHCVGGYCPDVLEGRSRIFSLRSAKGEPHVTVEVKPESMNSGVVQMDPNYQAFSKSLAGKEPYEKELLLREYVKENPPPQRIVQIKGKANRAPNPEYLPYVQDFVKSGKWSDVGDLQNTGLRRFGDAFNENEIKRIQDAGIDIPTWASPEEIKAIGDKVWPGQYGTPPGFAQGGLVQYDPAKIDALTQQLQEELHAA